jgi:hypothetical protein
MESFWPIVRAHAHTINVEAVPVVDLLISKFRISLESGLLLQPVNCPKGGQPRLVRANKEHLLIAGPQIREVV